MSVSAQRECVLRMSEALVVASIEYGGSATGVAAAFDYLLRWADVYHVEQRGPLVGVYRDASAAGPRRVDGEAWLPVPADLADLSRHDEKVRIKTVAPEAVAACIHRGYPDEVGPTIETLLRWVQKQNLARSQPLHRQVYLEAPRGRPSGWVIEIQVPVVPSEPKGVPAQPPGVSEGI